jgi:tRNA-dihydrouridine synthase B
MILANHHYSSNLVQGPLAGVSCAPFRALAWEYGNPAFCYTEMISCKTLLYSPHSHRRYVYKGPSEGPLCFQLSSNDPNELAQATKMSTDLGADLIDLNCGCPVKKIRSKGAGSHLLSEASKIYALICAMKNNTDKPVSIKIRVDAHSHDQFNADIAKAVADAGADFITVHGRHWMQGYDEACSYQDIQFFVESLPIPVIGNGDVACEHSLDLMLKTGCAGAMIGRAGVGQPWLTKHFHPLAPAITGEIFLKHLSGLCDLLSSEKFAILQMRTMAKYYARNLANKSEFCEDFNVCTSIERAHELVMRAFYEKTL